MELSKYRGLARAIGFAHPPGTLEHPHEFALLPRKEKFRSGRTENPFRGTNYSAIDVSILHAMAGLGGLLTRRGRYDVGVSF